MGANTSHRITSPQNMNCREGRLDTFLLGGPCTAIRRNNEGGGTRMVVDALFKLGLGKSRS